MVRQRPIREAVIEVMNGQQLGDNHNYDLEYAKIWLADTIKLIELAPLPPPPEEDPDLRWFICIGGLALLVCVEWSLDT